MSDSSDRGKRPGGGRPDGGSSGGRRDGAGPAKGRPSGSGKPPERGARPDRSGRPDGARPDRSGKPDFSARPERGGRPERGKPDGERRLWTRDGKPARGDKDAREPETEDRDPFGTRSVRPRHDDPLIPDDVQAGDLDRIARNELKTLSKDNAEGVARHLVMAARLIEENPTLAHAHAVSAARRAGRIGVVRETLAITAYATGDFNLALRELRTYRRITGRDDQLPMMVDSERGIGRPEKALELGRSVPRASLPVGVQVELAIAMSGARLDLGQTEAALQELQIPQLDPDVAYSWSPALFDSYASVLEDLGRSEEAELWRTRADVAADALEAAEDGADGEEVLVVEEDVVEGDLAEQDVTDEDVDD